MEEEEGVEEDDDVTWLEILTRNLDGVSLAWMWELIFVSEKEVWHSFCVGLWILFFTQVIMEWVFPNKSLLWLKDTTVR